MAPSVSDSILRTVLESAQTRLKRAVQALAPKHKGGEMEEFWAAQEALLDAERALAAAQNEPYAVPIEFPVQWDTGAPLPYLIQNECRTFLVFFLRDIDPKWDGTYTNIRHTNDASPGNPAVVEFKGCVSTRMGTPNDEVFHGHPLNGKGLKGYCPLEIKNSSWIKELEAINSVHSRYKPEHWTSLTHYLFGFRDSTFECVAMAFTVEIRAATVREVLMEICGKFVY